MAKTVKKKSAQKKAVKKPSVGAKKPPVGAKKPPVGKSVTKPAAAKPAAAKVAAAKAVAKAPAPAPREQAVTTPYTPKPIAGVGWQPFRYPLT
jgi:hypothetical protein